MKDKSIGVRPPTVADQFYPGDKRILMDMLDSLFRRAGGIPVHMDSEPVKGVVAPHAGYIYSGATAAHSYRVIAEGWENIDSFIVMGTSHTGLGAAVSISTLDFETPLGVMKNDLELGEMLISPTIQQSEEAHILEHSVEVQLPFLQYIANKTGREIPFVPIAFLSHTISTAEAAGRILYEAIRRSKKRVVVIASSDFTHAGHAYGYLPSPKKHLIDWMHEHDGMALERIKKLDLQGFMKVKEEFGLTICGAGAIGALLEYARLSGSKEAEVIYYTTSYEVSRTLSGVVGYASVAVR